jgi:glycosyltransferase involved in cell wall biosynthesis
MQDDLDFIIGYPSDSYPYRRNIINKVPGVKYKKIWDFLNNVRAAENFIQHISGGRIFSANDCQDQIYNFNFQHVSLIHFFNAISYDPTPWITTFETYIPRLGGTTSCHHGRQPDFSGLKDLKKFEMGISAIAHDSCKQIIALSHCNEYMQKEVLKIFPQYQGPIRDKLTVLHPPQKLFVSDYAEKGIDPEGELRFIFVGASFHRKGGMETIRALKRVRDRDHCNIKLTIISKLLLDPYATQESLQDIERTKLYIEANRDWIQYYPRVHYSSLLQMMKASHIGLLPTYADTYGYSVLELQASGCPVITTDVRALPEINDDEKGWIIQVPKNSLGEAIYMTKEDRLEISDCIQQGIAEIVPEIYHERKTLVMKSNKSIAGIKKNHSVDQYAESMKKIYHLALQDA